MAQLTIHYETPPPRLIAERERVQNSEHPSPGPMRKDLEELWRLRCELARERYEAATARYRKLLAERSDWLNPRPDEPLVLAQHEESHAMAEYARILKIFTDLTVHGRLPEQDVVVAEGGKDDRERFDFSS